MTSEEDTRSLGELLRREGLADQSAIDAALEEQRRDARRGVFRRLGEVLVETGVVKSDDVKRVLSLQGKTILVCPICIAQYNVDGYLPGTVALCERCSVALTIPDRLDRVKVQDDLRARTPSARDALGAASTASLDKGPLAAISQAQRFGSYEILGEISRGGMGVVYKARQPGLDRLIALKVILAGQAEPADVERFHREARAVSRLRHPNIVAIHEVGEVEGVNFFSMDFIEGLTLDKAVTTEGLNHREVAEIFLKVCEAVAYAHKQGVVHRDLKPRNVLVDKRRQPVLIDFGIARVQERDGEAGQLTKTGEILGSPAYLAPEYLAGTITEYDGICDVYSLGACLYHALSGRSPHADTDTLKIIRKAQTLDAPPIRTIARTVDRDLATIVMTAVERERDQRYATADEVAHDLRRYLDGEEIAARSSALTRWWRRVRTRVAVGLGLVVSFVLVGMSGYYASKIRFLEASKAQLAEGEHEALRARLADLSLRLAQSLVEAEKLAEAERAASEAILHASGARRREALVLRARARRLLGKLDEADADEKEAARGR